MEDAGLRWLAVPHGVRIAQPVTVSDDELTLEWVEQVTPSRDAAIDFGRRLASTHDAGAIAFGQPPPGWDGDGYIGDAPLSLRPTRSWGSFFARQRILPYARQAASRGALASGGLVMIERLCHHLVAGDYDDPAPPARIHGDLWSGNVLFAADGVVLIDPAAQGGHRISDLAMLALFGNPYLDDTLDAYAAASSHLPANWRDLLWLHQLHPLLVHAVLFGGGYGSQAVQAARHYAS